MPTPKVIRGFGNATACFVFSIAALLCCSLPSRAQSWPLPLGVASFTSLGNDCPPDEDGGGPLPGAQCYLATITGCVDYLNNNQLLPTVHAYVALSNPSGPRAGTIVMFNGGDGGDYPNFGKQGEPYALDYRNSNFQVFQVAWKSGETWRENTNQPDVKSMKYEACRPATLLRALYVGAIGHGGASGPGGMCAQGHSTGATALAFALAWYGAGTGNTAYLDSVLLTSGPAQADIQAGCQFPAVSPFDAPVTVCTGSKCVGGAATWSDCAQYDNAVYPYHDCQDHDVGHLNAASSVAHYTSGPGHPSNPPGNCNNYKNPITPESTSAYDAEWKDMSVVSANAGYSYPQTSVFAFLCATGFGSSDLPNNSAAQAWQYLDRITTTWHHGFYRVDGCLGSEVIWGPNATTVGGSGFDVSKNVMIADCVKRH